MAEQNNRVKYKFGQSELDLKNYIHNLGNNVQGYLNSKNWSEGQKQEFINAYKKILAGFNDQLANNTNRFSTDDFGTITDTQGIVSNKDNDDIDPVGSEYYYDNNGNRITTDDYNLLEDNKKKNYKSFSANREVASYFNTIGNALRQYTQPSKEQNSNNFDLSKHGFLPTWIAQQNPAGGDFDTTPYIQMDLVGEDGVRQTSKRAAYLREQLDNYLKSLSSYNYENTPFKDEATYRQRVQEAINGLENGYNSEDTIALNRAGISNEFLKNFFSDGTSQEQTPKSELEKQAEQAIKERQERAYNAQLQEEIDKNSQEKYELDRDQYFNDFQTKNPFKNTIKWESIPLSYNREEMNKHAIKKFNADNTNTEQVVNAIRQYINFDQLSKAIRGQVKITNQDGQDITNQHIANNLDWAAQADLFLNPKYLTDDGKSILEDGYYVVPGSENYDNWSYIAYNPVTRQYQEQSMLLNEELKKKMAYAEYDRRHKGVQKHWLGGVAKYVEENQKKAQKESEKQRRIDEKIEETGKTREQVKAAERRPMEEGFSTIDKVRLGTAAADAIAAAAAFIPGYGTAASGILGIGSTLTNIGADIADESMSGWDVAGNALYGLGMDVVGLIPGLGTTGKAAKIVRVLKPVSKLVMRSLQAYGMIHSADAFNKLMSNPSDMSADDWRNLVTGLQAISGEARYKGGKRAVNRVTTQRDVADVKTSTGKVATISKEDLDKLRKTKGLKAQNELFSKLTSGQQLQREFKNREINWKKPWKSRLSSDGPEVSLRTESSFLPEDNSWDARLFRRINKSIPQQKQQKKQQKKQQETQQSRFDSLRQLSSQTGKLTPQEINLINRQRAKQKLPALSQQEIDALNARRAYRGEQNALIAETFHGVFPTHSWSKKLGLSGIADNARYVQRGNQRRNLRETQKEVKAAQEELAEVTRQQRLAVPTGQGETISPDANQARFIMGLSRSIPTINPSRPPISNPPAIIPRQQVRIQQPQQSLFNYDRIKESLARAEKERLGRDIGEQRLQRAIEANPERSARLQSEEAYRNVRQAFNLYGAPQYKRPLTGAAYKAKQDMYNRLFNQRRYDVIEAFRNRELPHRQSNKKKKTSRDDRRTVKREEGGTLNLANVRKFQNGKTITNTTSKANWFNDMFSSDSMQKWIDSYTLNDYQKFNDLQRSWSANKKATQYVPGATPLAWNQGVQDRQKEWEQTGTNAAIEDLVTKGIITRPGNSGDNIEGGHVDGYFGEQEYLRHGGTEDSWKGHENELTKFQNMLKEKGLQYTLDPESGMYLMSPLQSVEIVKQSQKPESSNLNTAQKQTEDSTEPQAKGQVDIFSQIFSNPTITYGLPRALYADRINRRLTDMAKDSITPLLKDPLEVHRYTRSDLDAEMQGEKSYANLRRLASKPITSDGSLQTATQLEAEVKGQEAINAGKEKSNQVQRQYDELAWQQEKENAANRHETAMFNRAQQWAAKQDKDKLEQAYLSKKHNIWDTFGQQLEYDARQRLSETKALRDNFAQSDIHNAVMSDPNSYGANLTDEELEVWKQVLSGVQPSTLKDKMNIYLSAQKKISMAESNQLRQYYNIPNTRWTSQGVEYQLPYSPKITIINKNGGSIELAGIRAKTADAERFQRQIRECIDRNEKAIERLSKSMYGIISKIK